MKAINKINWLETYIKKHYSKKVANLCPLCGAPMIYLYDQAKLNTIKIIVDCMECKASSVLVNTTLSFTNKKELVPMNEYYNFTQVRFLYKYYAISN